jgi:hypothetical protein
MTDVGRLRDSTQIRLPVEALDGLRETLTERFVVTLDHEGERVRIIGSPTEIKAVGGFLARNGVAVC